MSEPPRLWNSETRQQILTCEVRNAYTPWYSEALDRINITVLCRDPSLHLHSKTNKSYIYIYLFSFLSVFVSVSCFPKIQLGVPRRKYIASCHHGIANCGYKFSFWWPKHKFPPSDIRGELTRQNEGATGIKVGSLIECVGNNEYNAKMTQTWRLIIQDLDKSCRSSYIISLSFIFRV